MTEAARPGAPNIARWLARHAAFQPDAPAIVYEDAAPISYGELHRRAGAMAAHLADAHTIRPGDRIAWLGFNDPAMLVLLFACARLGAILVPLNWRLTPAELGYIAADCTPKVLFHDGDHAGIAGDIVTGPDGCPALPAPPCNKTQGAPAPDAGRLGDPLLIVYTSGTTGRPKGAVLDQRALLANALNSIDMHGLTAADTVLVVLPLFHVGGLNIQLTPALYAGATVHLHARFDPDAVLAAIEAVRPDLLVLVPATMTALTGDPAWEAADFSCLRMLTTGSTIVPVELIARFEARGISVIQVYGSTETCPIATYQRPGDCRTRPDATGRPALLSEVRIVDDAGRPVRAPETPGEIQVRGDHVMQGYWNNPEATREALKDGWFASGDIGRIDASGELVFEDRKSNVIISGGENIYPAEIERVCRAVDGVEEIAVVGVPDAKWDEVPAAAIVSAGGPEAIDAVRTRLEAELARFKHPKHFIAIEALPRNAMGKVVAEDVRALVMERLKAAGD